MTKIKISIAIVTLHISCTAIGYGLATMDVSGFLCRMCYHRNKSQYR